MRRLRERQSIQTAPSRISAECAHLPCFSHQCSMCTLALRPPLHRTHVFENGPAASMHEGPSPGPEKQHWCRAQGALNKKHEESHAPLTPLAASASTCSASMSATRVAQDSQAQPDLWRPPPPSQACPKPLQTDVPRARPRSCRMRLPPPRRLRNVSAAARHFQGYLGM